ncbi:hypothetical protein O181_069905 [Austropuccinia psidii MF-1]|uniref:Uncharacterized protein n=1 Tax=Austropuccinia psidii MF-1 TaxID=1389203 RepID=A0A9Q3EVD8_9BASI|nr:hypothetical protein [Austropuccinia psidii MF-1]
MFLWKIKRKRFSLETQLEDFGTRIQKICLRNMTWVEYMQKMDGWHPNRQQTFLEEREARIKNNQETIQDIEEQWKEPNLIKEGTFVSKEHQSSPATHQSGYQKSVAGSSKTPHSSQ